MSAETSPRGVAIVPHTHWDREWYAPFQTFRMRLVELLDALLPVLERDETYTRFLLDGQTVVVDDYLAIRPEAEDRIRALVSAGRLSIGPWAVLMDEFMVSGETIVRDLQHGLRRSAALGGAMPVGYLPDMFGHVAQMPQLLRLAGLRHAVVWRGVPSAVDGTAFRWHAPDGSAVRAEYLYGSYSNGRDLPDDPDGLVERAKSFEAEIDGAVEGALLLMNGTDHQLPQPGVGRVAEAANAAQPDYRFAVTSLPEHLAAAPDVGLPEWWGELRSGARANILMGVASNRVDVHRDAAAAERALERRAEPLAALLLPPGDAAGRFLDEAWERLVLNAAHDSSCACSADEVVDAVRVRYQEARRLADGVTRRARRELATRIDAPAGSTIVVNPTARSRGGLVEVTVPGAGPVAFFTTAGTHVPTQVVEVLDGERFSATVTGAKIRWVVQSMAGPEFRGVRVAEHTLTDGDDGSVTVTMREAAPGEEAVGLDPLRTHLLARADDDVVFRVRLLRAPARRVVFAAAAVPGFGWRTFRAEPAGPEPLEHAGRVRVRDTRMENAHLSVSVDPSTGLVTLETEAGAVVAGAGGLVDGGDGGDTYNYSPPADDRTIDRPASVTVTTLESGPVRGRVRVEATYEWPTHAIGDERSCERRSDETAPAHVRTTYELRAGERFVRVRVELDHHHRDHRLRAHFPLPAPVSGSDAECAFAVVHRGLEAEGGPHELPLPTFPSRRFVDASDGDVGLAVLHDGLLEYELVDDGRELALTLLRATGYLSRAEPALRPNPAGPLDALDGSQLPGPLRLDYALLPHVGDWRAARCHEAADEFLVPLERGRGGGVGSELPPVGARLEVEGAEVSALYRDGRRLVLRCFNPTPETTSLEVRRSGEPVAGEEIDLCGAVVAPFPASRSLRPAEIVTLRLAG